MPKVDSPVGFTSVLTRGYQKFLPTIWLTLHGSPDVGVLLWLRLFCPHKSRHKRSIQQPCCGGCGGPRIVWVAHVYGVSAKGLGTSHLPWSTLNPLETQVHLPGQSVLGRPRPPPQLCGLLPIPPPFSKSEAQGVRCQSPRLAGSCTPSFTNDCPRGPFI